MTIWSLVAKRIEDGARTGVPRFDAMLRRIFPGIESVTVLPKIDLTCLEDKAQKLVSALSPDDIVITDNHLSLAVPPDIRTIVVHHGCAATHYARDPKWRTPHTMASVEGQCRMFELPNRTWVAPSWWVGMQFCDVCPKGIEYSFKTIPHWVEPIEPLPKSGKPKIIGDWRDHNKGADLWAQLATRCRQWEFQPLSFRDDAGRKRQYGDASLYLSLSLSEGGSYSVCDAEAANLPIVMTDVGNYAELDDAEVIRWQDRDNLDLVIAAIDRKVKAGRRKPSFYVSHTFDRWAGLWRGLMA